MQAAAQLRQARETGAAQQELGRQQQELAMEQEAFAVQRSSVVASFNAKAQQRIADLEVRLGPPQHHLHLPCTWMRWILYVIILGHQMSVLLLLTGQGSSLG